MAREVKYLSYSGLSHFKDKVFEVINPLISENKANILSIQNFLENPVFEEVNTNTLNVIDEINLNGTRVFNLDFLPLSGGTMTGPINSQSIIPIRTHTTSDTAYSLGSSTKQFNTTYTRYVDTVSGFNLRLRSGGVEHLNMMSGNVNSTANIIPTTTNTYNLGSSDYKWSNVYSTIFIGNLKGAMMSIVPTSSAGSSITEIPNAIRFDSVLAPNTTSGFGSGYNNAILTIGRYSSVGYASQLGFSGNGKVYYRSFHNSALDDSKTWNQIAFTSDIPTSLKNPYSLIIKGNGTTIDSYDGSAEKTVNITPSSIGAAASSHTHTIDDLPVIPDSKGGSGKTTLQDSANAYLNALATGSSNPTDNDYYIAQYAGGGETTKTYHRRPVSALYNYIKGKLDSVYATVSHTHSASNITSGTLAVSRGGTGLGTITSGHVIIGNGTNTPTTSKIISITNAEIDAICAQ